jgi:hypothetical protein
MIKCLYPAMAEKKLKAKKWKNMNEFWKDLEEEKKDPLFMKALKDFIRYHSQ